MSNTPLRNSGNEDVERLLDRIDSGQRTASSANNLGPGPVPHEDAQAASPEVPSEIGKQIKSAWVAACISGGLTLIATLFAMAGFNILGLGAWNLLDVALIFGLAFGIYKKSRVCAVLMLVYYLASKIFEMVETEKATGLVVALFFSYFFWQGVRGTFAHHKLKPALAAVPIGQS